MKLVCEGRRARLESREMVLPNGKKAQIDRVVFPNSVSILPLHSDGRITLLKQYRPAIGEWIIEAPAGTIKEGENPVEAAKRELEEEAGLIAGNMVEIGGAYLSPGYSTEFMYFYIATSVKEGRQNLEDHEVIDTFETTLDEAIDMTRKGEIKDAKTIMLLLYADTYLRNMRSQ